MANVQTETKPAMYGATASPITSAGTGAGAAPTVAVNPQTKTSGSFVAPLVGAGIGALAQNVLGSNPLKQILSDPAGAYNKAIGALSGSSGVPASTTPNIGAIQQTPASVQNVVLPAGTTQAQVDAQYGQTNGKSNYVISGIDTGTGKVVATQNTSIGGTNLSGVGGITSTATAPADQAANTYFQDASGNIYDGSGNLYAVKAGNTYYVNTGADTWTNADTGSAYTASELFGGGIDSTATDTTSYDPSYDPYSGYSSSDFTNYYTPTSYAQDLSSAQDTGSSNYWTDPNAGLPYIQYKKGGLATPLMASGGEVKSDGVHMAGGGFLDTIMGYLTSGGVQGALVGSLLSQLMSGSSSGGGGATPVDMSKVGAIAPRTTSFGMGHPNYVTYGQYGQPTGDAGTQYNQTFSDLGVSGFAPRLSPLTTLGVNPLAHADGGSIHPYYTFGQVVRPEDNLADGGRPMNTNVPMQMGQTENANVPMLQGRKDYRAGAAVEGPGDGQSDDIPAMLADGEYVMDAEIVSALGNGSNKAGAKVLDKMRENIRKHKRSGALNSIPPKAKSPLAYMKGAK